MHTCTHCLHAMLLKIHPKNIFRKTLEEYAQTVKIAHDEVVRATALLLMDTERIRKLRPEFNYYPTCPDADIVRQVSRHADVSAVSFLLIDREVEALEVLKDDQWFKVPIIPHAIVVLVGDQIEMMSNGILKSPEHRVKPDLEKERISMALFCSPDLEKEVGPLKALVTEDQPPFYTTAKSYINLFERHYTKGIRPITAVKI
ncbi:hypothetical protein Cgig2_027089 [Carnegiea gigantea]|uniref:Fe2OG dioxygenase domain-containing protein n=1 Tax=Carnegiea gigantea TaxID=171969 RepID=A0A9Q1K9C1_9CARY|nr:hypothetical protein Cgig2_027089 [Carnegiea gigantea]